MRRSFSGTRSLLFVGHEGDYAIDHGELRWGLAYQRKRAPSVGDGAFTTHLGDSLKRTLDVASRLRKEQALTALSFDTSEIALRIADRLHAPNDASTFAAVQIDLEATAKRLWGEGATATCEPGDGVGLFAARLRAQAGADATPSELLARVTTWWCRECSSRTASLAE